MWGYLIAIIVCGSVIGTALVLASKNGSKQAQLEALKAELRKQAEEQARVARINNSVANMSDSDVRNSLHKIATQQSKRVQ